MKPRSFLVLGFLVAASVPAIAQTEKVVAIHGGPKVSVTVPMGYSYETKANLDGSIGVRMDNPVWGITIDVRVARETDPAATTREWQQNMLISFVADALAVSAETGYDFKPLQLTSGTGVYCVFQAKDAPKPKPGESIPNTHLTGGLKAWKGCVVIARILSPDVTSPEYLEAFATLTNGTTKM